MDRRTLLPAMNELLDLDRYAVLSLSTEAADPLVHGVWELQRFHPDETEVEIAARGRAALLWLLDTGLIELIRSADATNALDPPDARREIDQVGWDYLDGQPYFRSTESGMKVYVDFRPPLWKPAPPGLEPRT